MWSRGGHASVANKLLGATVTKPFESAASLSKPFRQPTMVTRVVKETSTQHISPVQTAPSNQRRSPQAETPATNSFMLLEPPVVDDHISHEGTWESKSHCPVPALLSKLVCSSLPDQLTRSQYFMGARAFWEGISNDINFFHR